MAERLRKTVDTKKLKAGCNGKIRTKRLQESVDREKVEDLFSESYTSSGCLPQLKFKTLADFVNDSKKKADLTELIANQTEKAFEKDIAILKEARATARILRDTANEIEESSNKLSLPANAFVYRQMLAKSVMGAKEMAVLAEMAAKKEEEFIGRATECLLQSRLLAKESRKTAEDIEESTRKFYARIGASTSAETIRQTKDSEEK